MMNSIAQLIPWSGLVGGMIIGVAVSVLIFFNGRIAGVSGIIGGIYKSKAGDMSWRFAFLLGLLIAPLFWQLFLKMPEIHIDASYGLLAFAGLIVGFGARYGSGCTSGHGVCGISRMSSRSILATFMFMMMGFLTVYLVRHVFVL